MIDAEKETRSPRSLVDITHGLERVDQNCPSRFTPLDMMPSTQFRTGWQQPRSPRKIFLDIHVDGGKMTDKLLGIPKI